MKKHLPLVVTLLMVAVLCGLGVWQLQRLAWKEKILAEIAQRTAEAPIPLTGKIQRVNDWEFRRVRVEGVLLSRDEMRLKPRTQNGRLGFNILTPLRIRQTDIIVLVDRGFADEDTVGAFYRPRRTVQLEGIVRLPHKGMFTPDNNPAKDDWYWADPEAVAKAKGYRHMLPIVVAVTGGVPDLPNNHLQYAIFWFVMAGVAIAVYVAYRRKEKKAAA